VAAASLQGKILLVGAGKMGGALLEGWLTHGLSPADVAIVDPAPPAEMATFLKEQKIERLPKPGSFLPDAVVIAVKPQAADEVVPKVAAYLRPRTVVISIMAGRTLASIEKHLPPASLVVRGLPNTSASIGRGIRSRSGINMSAPLRNFSRPNFSARSAKWNGSKTSN